jgi:hypothetical protein
VVSRRLATVVAEDFQANGDGEQDLREWLCGMDLAVWRARFAASPMDLRAMLEFARPRGHRLAARLLGGDLVTIQIRAVGEPRASETAVFGDVADEPPPARLGVWAAGELLGVVPPEHSAELDAIRGTGIPMAVSLAVQGDQLQASVQLTDLTARSGEIT